MGSKAGVAGRKAAVPVDVREACVTAAHAVIAEQGVEHLSLRDVARRLGVSHQAPYKHYPTRDHLLAEVIARSFERFREQLDARPAGLTPEKDLEALGGAYLDFALRNPLEYRLMFGTPWPEGTAQARIAQSARHAFDVLRQALARRNPRRRAERIELDALFMWSSMHGVASVLHGSVLRHLTLSPGVTDQAARHIMARVRAALEAP